MAVEEVPDISMFRSNTAGFVHDLPATHLANVDGDASYVRVQVLTNAGALDRAKQLTLTERLTALVAEAAGDPALRERTWVLLTRRRRGAGASRVTPTPTTSWSPPLARRSVA